MCGNHRMQHPKTVVKDIIQDKKQNENAKNGNESVCLSKECVRAAAAIIDRIDFSVDPCTNFYDFACGRFLKTKTVPDDHTSRNILQEMQDDIYTEMKNYLQTPIDEQNDAVSIKQVKRFYASCMNDSSANDELSAAKALFDLMKASGGSWSLLDDLYAGATILENVYLINASIANEQYNNYFIAYTELQYKVLQILAEFKGVKEAAFDKRRIEEQIASLFRFEADLANVSH
ncbi:endothelin-converting enzyme 1-like protein [Dinothrombium tinctorium]|uniref:Endothelin-converting enzyme 1-like protein n=1 Tax=Dinothrombium tinctorium TaxID=1965070 RepID=A0A3S4RAX5_9ACAR|nr:endothelin-converting enzyme 1-like protein [Dinothrombium tinctorium]